jgi:protease-4
MASDKIYAEPSTITGSIGVFGLLPSFEGSLAKLGVGVDGVKTTPLSGEPDLLRGPSPEADQLLQSSVEATYRRFLTLVSQQRKMPVEQVDRVAQGRIWAGGTAHQLKLIDAFGGLDDAIAEAARLAKLEGDAAKPVWLEAEPGFFDEFLLAMSTDEEEEQASADAFGRIAMGQRQLMLRAAADAERLLSTGSVQARCLECPAAATTPSRGPSGTFAGLLLKLLGA